MSFLNAILLGGIAALAIPIIIHLFHKSHFRVVRWGAMHLLENVIRTNQRRIKFEQWLLLALRAALPVILALLMARPIWKGAQSLLGDAKTSTADVYLRFDDRGGADGFEERRAQLTGALAQTRRKLEHPRSPVAPGPEPRGDRPPRSDTARWRASSGSATCRRPAGCSDRAGRDAGPRTRFPIPPSTEEGGAA